VASDLKWRSRVAAVLILAVIAAAIGLRVIVANGPSKSPVVVVMELTMPEGWQTDDLFHIPAEDAYGSREAYNRFMGNGALTASYTIYEYRNRIEARFAFRFLPRPRDDGGLERNHGQASVIDTPDRARIAALATRADQQQVIWSTDYLSGEPRCSWIARYDSRVVDFTSNIDAGEMTVADFERVLSDIDRHMVSSR
jgi:hypothetical protein